MYFFKPILCSLEGKRGLLCVLLITCLWANGIQSEPLRLDLSHNQSELTFSFSAQSERLYTIEYRPDLTTGAWTDWETFTDVPGTNGTLTYSTAIHNPLISEGAFFRLREDPLGESPDSLLLARYEFTNASPAAHTNHAEITASDFAISTGNLLYGTANETSWSGSGVPYARGNSGWDAETPETARFFSHQLNTIADREMLVTEVSFLARSTGQGPSAYAVLIDELLIETGDLPDSETIAVSVPIPEGVWTTQSVVQIAGWTNNSRIVSGGGEFHVDDVTTLGQMREAISDEPAIPVPVVTSPTFENILENSVSLASAVIDDGGVEIPERGFVWSITADFDPEQEGTYVREFGEFGEDTFSLMATGLPEGTEIYVRAYAVNASGTGWSDATSFKTPADQVLAFYSFSGDTPAAEAHRSAIQPSEFTISSGNQNFSWVASHAASWQQYGADDPYIRAGGSWDSDDPESARRFEFSLESDPGWYMTVTGITFVARSTAAGPSAIGVAVNGNQVLSQDMPADDTLLIHMPVTGFVDTNALNIWIQGWTNGTRQTSGGGDLRVDNVLVTGSMSMDIETDAPSVHLPTATDAEHHNALLGGTVANDGGSTLIERGIIWSTVDEFHVPDGGFLVAESGTFDLGAFALPVWQLPPDTTIYYRAFASSAAGTGYSEQASFTSPALPQGLLSVYEFTGGIITPHQVHPYITSSHFVHNTGRPGLALVNASSWTGSGVPYAQASSNFDSPSPENARHFIYTKEARNGSTFSITNIQLLARATAQGPSAVSISINDDLIGTIDVEQNVTTPISMPVNGVSEQSLATIRILGWDNESRPTAGTGLLQVDDILTQGTIQGTPHEPITSGRPVRIASVNVEDGIANNLDALRLILERLDADIVAFQELYNNQDQELEDLADELDYPHWVIGPAGGISDVQRVGYFSRFEFASEALLSPPGASEFARPVMRGVFDIPDVEQPLVLWAVHKKALNDELSQFRRAVETLRIIEDIQSYQSANPDHVHYAVLGDMNADFFTQSQRESFTEAWFNDQSSGLPAAYSLGSDIVFPVQYYRFPDDRYDAALPPLQRVPMTHPGGYGIWSFQNADFVSRLDYVFVSTNLAAMHPMGEIYYSRMDGPFTGLPKAGSPLPASTSLSSSDHLPVFVDVYLPYTSDPQAEEWSSVDEPVGQVAAIPTAASEFDIGDDAGRAELDARSSSDSIPDGSFAARLAQISEETSLHIRPHESGGTELTFFAHEGFVYTVESIQGLGNDHAWSVVEGGDQLQGANEWVTVIDSTQGRAGEIRAYRLRMSSYP